MNTQRILSGIFDLTRPFTITVRAPSRLFGEGAAGKFRRNFKKGGERNGSEKSLWPAFVRRVRVPGSAGFEFPVKSLCRQWYFLTCFLTRSARWNARNGHRRKTQTENTQRENTDRKHRQKTHTEKALLTFPWRFNRFATQFRKAGHKLMPTLSTCFHCALLPHQAKSKLACQIAQDGWGIHALRTCELLCSLQLGHADRQFAEAVRAGLNWLVISKDVENMFPELASVAQSAANVSVAKVESETFVEGLNPCKGRLAKKDLYFFQEKDLYFLEKKTSILSSY